MAWRRCTKDEANDEIFAVARVNRLSPLRVAHELAGAVACSGGTLARFPALDQQWGDFLGRRGREGQSNFRNGLHP